MRAIFHLTVAAGLGLALTTAGAAEKPRQLVVTVGSTVRVQMSTKRPISEVINDRPDVLRVMPVPDDPTTVMVTGLAPGRATLTMTDVDGKKEVRDLGKKK